jgi:hypothetical protein
MFNSIKFVEDNYYDFFFFLEFDNLFSEDDLLKLDSFRKINEKKLVAGQEDLIMNILYNLKNRK